MYRALDVARYIIKRCHMQQKSISNLKLQKILYFVQAEFLVSTGRKCFSDAIEAWDFGPVVPEAYREYKQFGSSNIPRVSYIIDFDSEDIWNSKVKRYVGDSIREADQKRIEAVVDRFAEYSATDLVSITHNQSPWKDAYVPHMNNEITTDAIKEYFNGWCNGESLKEWK